MWIETHSIVNCKYFKTTLRTWLEAFKWEMVWNIEKEMEVEKKKEILSQGNLIGKQ